MVQGGDREKDNKLMTRERGVRGKRKVHKKPRERKRGRN